jgi:hypothetical protein
MKQNNSGQLSLMAFGDMDVATRNVFTVSDKKDELSHLTSTSVRLMKNKDIAIAMGLDAKDDKAAIEANVLMGKDALKAKLAQLLVKAQSDPYWTGNGLRVVYSKAGKSGRLSKAKIILSLEEARRPQGPTDEEIAQAMHLAVEEVRAMRERQLAALAQAESRSAEAESTAKLADETPDEKAARELAEEARLQAKIAA